MRSSTWAIESSVLYLFLQVFMFARIPRYCLMWYVDSIHWHPPWELVSIRFSFFFFFFSFNVFPLRLLNAVSRLDEVGYSLSRVVSTNKSVAGFEFGSIWKRWWAVIKFTLPAPLFLACSVFSPFFFISSFQCQEETNVVTYHTCIV